MTFIDHTQADKHLHYERCA